MHDLLFNKEFDYNLLKSFIEAIFDKLKKFQTLVNPNEEEPKKKKEQVKSIVTMLVEMGFSEEQAQTAMRNIDYPDVNLAAEWLFSHPEVPAQ